MTKEDYTLCSTQEKTIGAERSIFTTALSSIVIELVAEPTLSFVLVLVSPFLPAPLPSPLPAPDCIVLTEVPGFV